MGVRTLLLCLAQMSVLWVAACASVSTTSVGDGASEQSPLPGARIDGHGYAVFAPAGEGWTLVQRTPEEVVFGKRRPAAQARRGDGPYLLLAGVHVLPAEAGEDFADSARQWLTRRFQVPGRRLVSLDLHVAPWQGAACVQYDALQVDRYDFDEPTTRFEYVHIGRLCRHPRDATLWIQVFASGRSLRVDGSPAGLQEAQDFVDRVLFVTPRSIKVLP
jgi:hypothetical protein